MFVYSQMQYLNPVISYIDNELIVQENFHDSFGSLYGFLFFQFSCSSLKISCDCHDNHMAQVDNCLYIGKVSYISITQNLLGCPIYFCFLHLRFIICLLVFQRFVHFAIEPFCQKVLFRRHSKVLNHRFMYIDF